jgi:hypothetical protein
MGSGLAKEIRTHFPGCYYGYKEFCKDKNPKDLLGKVAWIAETTNSDTEIVTFANIFGQLNYGRDRIQYTSYKALADGLNIVHKFAKENAGGKLSVSIPHGIGCGLGGGDWIVVKEIIEKIFNDEVVCEIWKI